MIEDLSYASDDELSPSKSKYFIRLLSIEDGRKPSAGKGKKDDDLLELDLTEADYKALNNRETATYVRKPVSQVDTSDLRVQNIINSMINSVETRESEKTSNNGRRATIFRTHKAITGRRR